MKSTNDIRVLCERLEMLAGFLEFTVTSGDQDQQSLIGRGNVQAKFESGEIRNGGALGFALVTLCNFLKGGCKVATENLVWSAPTPGQAFLSVGRENAEGGVFKSPVEMAPHDLLSFFAFVGIDADTDKAAGGIDDVLLAELTVRRLGVTRSENARDAAAL